MNFDQRIGGAHDGDRRSRWSTSPVMTFAANPGGLHDMHGNVWERCSDWCGEYPSTAVREPLGPERGDIRILRAGWWFHGATDARSSQRDPLDPGRRRSIYGLRVAMDAGG